MMPGRHELSEENAGHWWYQVPEHIKPRVLETARRMECPHTTNNQLWWAPVVDHLIEVRQLQPALDYEREHREANALANAQVATMRREVAEMRKQVSESRTADLSRRIHTVIALLRDNGSRKTIPVGAVWKALGPGISGGLPASPGADAMTGS